ncbi:MAG TPA: hypothetical protein VIL28_08410 [Steroidobacteraceae bacterium]
MTNDNKSYWFPAKRYGWGWGLPIRWQGWAVMAIYALMLVVAAVKFLRVHERLAFVGTAAALTVVLVLVCWWKGEPPRWRWGEDRADRDMRPH